MDKRIAAQKSTYPTGTSDSAGRAARDHRYNVSEKGRARYARYDLKRRSDPEYRRRKTFYMMWYRHRRKRAEYAAQGLLL